MNRLVLRSSTLQSQQVQYQSSKSELKARTCYSCSLQLGGTIIIICVCVRACVRACVCVCVRVHACVRACACVHA